LSLNWLSQKWGQVQYDIKVGSIGIRAAYQPYFNDYRNQIHAVGIDVALLNVPVGVQPAQFTTLRQARAMGVKIPSLVIAKLSNSN
jgi:hypothetical protein